MAKGVKLPHRIMGELTRLEPRLAPRVKALFAEGNSEGVLHLLRKVVGDIGDKKLRAAIINILLHVERLLKMSQKVESVAAGKEIKLRAFQPEQKSKDPVFIKASEISQNEIKEILEMLKPFEKLQLRPEIKQNLDRFALALKGLEFKTMPGDKELRKHYTTEMQKSLSGLFSNCKADPQLAPVAGALQSIFGSGGGFPGGMATAVIILLFLLTFALGIPAVAMIELFEGGVLDAAGYGLTIAGFLIMFAAGAMKAPGVIFAGLVVTLVGVFVSPTLHRITSGISGGSSF